MSTNTSLTGPWAFAFVISIENVIESKQAWLKSPLIDFNQGNKQKKALIDFNHTLIALLIEIPLMKSITFNQRQPLQEFSDAQVVP